MDLGYLREATENPRDPTLPSSLMRDLITGPASREPRAASVFDDSVWMHGASSRVECAHCSAARSSSSHSPKKSCFPGSGAGGRRAARGRGRPARFNVRAIACS